MTMMQPKVRVTFLVDLNSVTDGDRVSVLLNHAIAGISVAAFPFEEGDVVSVCDDDGGKGDAVVVRSKGRLIDLRIDWATWHSDDSFIGPTRAGLVLGWKAPDTGRELAETH